MPNMISNITSEGFTIRHFDGSFENIETAFNNDGGDGFLYKEGNTTYEFNETYVTSRGYGSVFHEQLATNTTWTIVHNMGRTPNVTTTSIVDGESHVILPKSVQILDVNTILILHTNDVAGTAVLR